jgi:hypothetical protein
MHACLPHETESLSSTRWRTPGQWRRARAISIGPNLPRTAAGFGWFARLGGREGSRSQARRPPVHVILFASAVLGVVSTSLLCRSIHTTGERDVKSTTHYRYSLIYSDFFKTQYNADAHKYACTIPSHILPDEHLRKIEVHILRLTKPPLAPRC